MEEYFQGKIDNLERKIATNEERFLNSTDPVQAEILEKIIAQDTATLRGYYHDLVQIASQHQPAPPSQNVPTAWAAPGTAMYQQQLAHQQRYGQNVGVPQVETAQSEGYSNYSPISGDATPRSRSATNIHDDEFVHDTKILKSALKRISPNFSIQFSQGNLLIILHGMPFVTIRGVSTSLHLKNIYYLIKVMRDDPYSWNEYIRRNGIPTLVQATITGPSPPTIDDDFTLREFDPRMFEFGS